MSRALYALAAFLTAAIMLAHVFLGGPVAVDPLIASQDVPENAVWLLYFTWHDGTIALTLCAGAFAYAAATGRQRTIALFAALITLGFGLLGLGVAAFGNGILWGTPAPYAFGLIGIIGLVGVLADTKP